MTELTIILIVGFIFFGWRKQTDLREYSELVSPDLSDFEDNDVYDDVSTGKRLKVDFSKQEIKFLYSFETPGLERITVQRFKLDISASEAKIFLLEENEYSRRDQNKEYLHTFVVKDSNYILSKTMWDELNPGINLRNFEDEVKASNLLIKNGKILENPLSSMLIIRWNLYCTKYSNYSESTKFKHYEKQRAFIQRIASRDYIYATFLE